VIEITPLMRYLQRLAAAEKRIENKLEVLGCRRAKLSPLNGNGCKPRGTSPTMNLHMCKLLDELSEIEEEINITKHKINKVRNAIDVMPTARYRDILNTIFFKIEGVHAFFNTSFKVAFSPFEFWFYL